VFRKLSPNQQRRKLLLPANQNADDSSSSLKIKYTPRLFLNFHITVQPHIYVLKFQLIVTTSEMHFKTLFLLLTLPLLAQAMLPLVFMQPLRPNRLDLLRMKIDYGTGYDPRNRPGIQQIANSESIGYTQSLSLAQTPQQADAAPMPLEKSIALASNAVQTMEVPNHTTDTRVIHDGVIMLKLCVDVSNSGLTSKVVQGIRYCSSGYDPKNRLET
tara:strand:+ start:68652 stop:69296 length:645 start_codon:yes stop_codon:yes gene_type:complete